MSFDNDPLYCLNNECPFRDCEHHAVNAPRKVKVRVAWLDGTCRQYIDWCIDQIEKPEKDREDVNE